jgi:protein SFI1
VRRAQDSRDKSSRALFAAYGEVLEALGLQRSDDAVLHRFLFRMQKHKRAGEDLLPRFKRVLKEAFDIDIEINEDGEGIEVTTSLDATRHGAQASLGRYSRRGSFDSFFDGTADKVAGTEHGDLQARTRVSQQGVSNGNADTWTKRRARSDTEAHSYQQPQPPLRSRVNGIAPRRSVSGPHQPNHKRSTSVSSRGSLQIRRGGHQATYRISDHDTEESEFTDRTKSPDHSNIQIPGINAPFPDDHYESPRPRPHQRQQYVPDTFRPSDTRLMDDAETFEEQRLHRVTRECIRIWRTRTQERMSIREDMERAAIAFERRTLLRASLGQLHDMARVVRSDRETNQFFDRLETRANKARNLFLLTKAFTHWQKSAEDEAQRTSVARRHILRTRFFNGWRELTAVNTLKVQHFVLAKFLQKWKARYAVVRNNSEFAVLRYEDHIVRRVFDRWFFAYFTRGALAWRAGRTARTTLQKWSEIVQVLRERDAWATDRRDRTVLRKTFQTWRQKAVAIQAQEPQANSFRHTSLLRSAFRTLQKQSQLQPPLQQFQSRVNGRLVRTTFQDWRRDAQLSRQARNVDRMRVLRNAYTAWNDRLRIKALEDRINDRVIVECLYKWTLASRVSLFQRVHSRQLKESTFLTWVTRTNQRANTLDAAEARFAQFKRAQLTQSCLRKMEAITTEKRREEFAILAQYQQKLKQRIFDKLKERHAHFQQLKQWSADARFYVLSKHTLRTWSEATQHARRNRRRDTYSQVRRTIKTNLVRKVFGHWREKANRIAMLNQRAADMLETRNLQDSGTLLHRWHDRTLVLQQQHAQATNLYNFKLSRRYLSIWSSRMDGLHILESQAVALRQESTEIAATSAFKKMGWRLWNFQRQEDTARALYERNFEKHVRAMIRFWAERTSEQRVGSDGSPTPSRRSRSSRRDRDDNDNQGSPGDFDDDDNDDNDNGGREGQQQSGDETQRLEAWTAFDATALDLNNNLDLSLSLTPEHAPRQQPSTTPNPYIPLPPHQPPTSILRRPNTYPQPESAPPATILEDDESDLDFGDGAQSTFWTGTPMPPPSSKPGYLKTPSKRSVARAKRPELPPSPEKQRVLSPVRRPLTSILERERGRGLGTMSAPPVQSSREVRGGVGGGVTSFKKRLREGGFGGSVAGRSSIRGRGRGLNPKGKGRVGFGDVSQVG